MVGEVTLRYQTAEPFKVRGRVALPERVMFCVTTAVAVGSQVRTFPAEVEEKDTAVKLSLNVVLLATLRLKRVGAEKEAYWELPFRESVPLLKTSFPLALTVMFPATASVTLLKLATSLAALVTFRLLT